MKKYQAILGIIVSAFLGVFLSDISYAYEVDCGNALYPSDLQYCLSNGKNIVLNSDILDTPMLIYNNPSKSITVDLNGHSVTGIDGSSDDIFAIIGGEITFTGSGMIGSPIASNLPLRIIGSSDESSVAYVTVNIDNGVVLSSNNYGVVIGHESYDHSYATFLNFNGRILGGNGIYVMDNLNDIENYPSIHIGDEAVIQAYNGHAIIAGGYAGWNIGAADIKGKTGIGIKQGKFYIDGVTLTATGEDTPILAPVVDDLPNTGAAIQIESILGKIDRSEMYIKSGTLTSEHGYAIVEHASDDDSKGVSFNKFSIYAGTLHGTEDFNNSIISSNTGAFIWYYGDGQMLEDGSMFYEVDDLYDSHKMTVVRYAKDVKGFDEILKDPRYSDVERIVPVYSPYDALYEDELAALKDAGYSNAKIVNVFDITPRAFLFDTGEPTPGMSKIYSLVTSTGEDYPITFEMLMSEVPELADGYKREYFVFNFHIDLMSGEYTIEKIPATVSEDGETYSFSTYNFSTFALAYEDTVIPPSPEEDPEEDPDSPAVPNTGNNSQESQASVYPIGSIAIVIFLSFIFYFAYAIIKI